MFKKKSIDKNYISPIDQALEKFNQTHPRSPAQQDEIDKYRRVYQLRDHATAPEKDKDLWDFEE